MSQPTVNNVLSLKLFPNKQKGICNYIGTLQQYQFLNKLNETEFKELFIIMPVK